MSIPAHVSKNEPFLLIDVYVPEQGHTAEADALLGYRFKFSSEVKLDKGT